MEPGVGRNQEEPRKSTDVKEKNDTGGTEGGKRSEGDNKMSACLRDDNVNCLPPIRTSTQGGVRGHDKDIGKRARRTLRAPSGRERERERDKDRVGE